MNMFDALIESYLENDNIVYHVTRSKNLPAIMRGGLKPMMTSNWIKAGDKSRYGNGEVYAFENIKDAIKWAAKMEWEFYQNIGAGKIVILTLKNAGEWKEDIVDGFDQAGSHGKWLKQMKAVPPEDIIKVTVVTRDVISKLKQ